MPVPSSCRPAPALNVHVLVIDPFYAYFGPCECVLLSSTAVSYSSQHFSGISIYNVGTYTRWGGMLCFFHTVALILLIYVIGYQQSGHRRGTAHAPATENQKTSYLDPRTRYLLCVLTGMNGVPVWITAAFFLFWQRTNRSLLGSRDLPVLILITPSAFLPIFSHNIKLILILILVG